MYLNSNNKNVKKLLNNKIVKEELMTSLAVGSALVGTVVGAIIMNMLNKNKQKFLSCSSLKDDYYKYVCMINIIDSMIENLKKVKTKCEPEDDPATCELAVLRKIDNLISKKGLLMDKLNRIERIREEQ